MANKKQKKQPANKTPETCILPCSNLEMEQFLDNNKKKLREHVVNFIDYAVDENLKQVPVFQFKNTNFIVIVFREKFMESLEDIFKTSLHEENYELCAKIKNIENKIKTPKLVKELKKYKMI
jgi:hypoxanthine phosphoribosyltransferase